MSTVSAQHCEWHMRAATRGDVATIEALERRLFPDDAWSSEVITEEITHPSRSYWVIETAGQVIGYAGVMVVAETADVHNIAVLPDYEGQGIGSALLQQLHAEAIARGAREILLEVRADNHRAQALYRKFAYTEIAVRPQYYPGGQDAVTMRAELTPSVARSTTDLTSHMTGAATHNDPTTLP